MQKNMAESLAPRAPPACLSLSRVQLLVTPWTAAYWTPLSMGFSRQKYWSGVPLPSPRDHHTFFVNNQVVKMLRLVISKVPVATTELWSWKNTKVAIYSMEMNGYCGVLKNCMETEFAFQIISTWWKIFFFFKFFTHPFKNLEIIINLWAPQNQATGHIWFKGFSMSSIGL